MYDSICDYITSEFALKSTEKPPFLRLTGWINSKGQSRDTIDLIYSATRT